MLAVVICLRGRSSKLAADFLRGKDFTPAIALGPGNVLATLRDLQTKQPGPAWIVTDSSDCIDMIRNSTTYGRTPVLFWGEDPAKPGTKADACLSEHADLTDLADTLRRLAAGLPPRPDHPGSASRQRRI